MYSTYKKIKEVKSGVLHQGEEYTVVYIAFKHYRCFAIMFTVEASEGTGLEYLESSKHSMKMESYPYVVCVYNQIN